MCHLSLKASDMFDPNPMQNSDKIVAKCISVKNKTLFKLDLDLEDNNLGNKRFHL